MALRRPSLRITSRLPPLKRGTSSLQLSHHILEPDGQPNLKVDGLGIVAERTPDRQGAQGYILEDSLHVCDLLFYVVFLVGNLWNQTCIYKVLFTVFLHCMTATSHERKCEGSAHQMFENLETLFLHSTTTTDPTMNN